MPDYFSPPWTLRLALHFYTLRVSMRLFRFIAHTKGITFILSGTILRGKRELFPFSNWDETSSSIDSWNWRWLGSFIAWLTYMKSGSDDNANAIGSHISLANRIHPPIKSIYRSRLETRVFTAPYSLLPVTWAAVLGSTGVQELSHRAHQEAWQWLVHTLRLRAVRLREKCRTPAWPARTDLITLQQFPPPH